MTKAEKRVLEAALQWINSTYEAGVETLNALGRATENLLAERRKRKGKSK